ncbi:MAG: shikimate dehydrogenase [Phycisphaerae bacterium]|nr:shikimate dehydrogenase [Phycisphaerae bacterium]
MTWLVTPVCAATLSQMRAQIDQAVSAGAEGVELRLDYLTPQVTPSEVAEVLSALEPGSWIATLRSADEGGMCHVPADARLMFLLQATANRTGWLDFECRAFEDEFCKNMWTAILGRRQWILSLHDFQGQPEDVPALAHEIVSAGPAVVAKIAWQGHALHDNIMAFETMRKLGERVIVIVMGEAGLASRVLAKKFGAAITYCALSSETATAPGQATLDEMLHKYRWNAISPETRVFGVLGSPVRHSMSPVLFNRMFDHAGVDAVYLPMLVAGGAEELVTFLEHCRYRPWLDVGGFSVTLPHKQSACHFVGAYIEPLADRIGAVNTLVMRDGCFHGYNTDYAGALDALCHGLDCERSDLHGMGVDVLGAGGVARAVVAGLADCGCEVTIFNRTAVSAEALARDFECSAAPWEQRFERSGRVVINCTSVGMSPHTGDSPLPGDALGDGPVVFDTVYNPVETRLLHDAKQAGCVTVDGVEMFVRQAAAQYRLWFDQAADLAMMRKIVLQALGGDGNG